MRPINPLWSKPASFALTSVHAGCDRGCRPFIVSLVLSIAWRVAKNPSQFGLCGAPVYRPVHSVPGDQPDRKAERKRAILVDPLDEPRCHDLTRHIDPEKGRNQQTILGIG